MTQRTMNQHRFPPLRYLFFSLMLAVGSACAPSVPTEPAPLPTAASATFASTLRSPTLETEKTTAGTPGTGGPVALPTAGPTISPSPASPPLGTPLPAPAAYSPLLGEMITAPPGTNTPAPPPPWHPNVDGKWWSVTARAVTDLVNWAQGDPAVIVAQMHAWSQLPDHSTTPNALLNAWAETADLDNDGVVELLLSVPLRIEICQGDVCQPSVACEHGFCRGLVYLFEADAALFVPVHQFQGVHSQIQLALERPRIYMVADLNGDGLSEVIVNQELCGAHTCSAEVLVGRWDGRQWHELGNMWQSNAEITLTDADGDGSQEIRLSGGTVNSVGGGLQRRHTLVYVWDGDRYQLKQDIPAASDHPYFLMLDAYIALGTGDLDRALTLALQVVENPEYVPADAFPLQENERAQIISYAAIEAMLVHALRQEAEAMQALLTLVETTYAGTPFVRGAEVLWQTYQETVNAFTACQAMATAVQEAAEPVFAFSWIGYNTEVIRPEGICPFPGGSQ